MPSDPEFVFHEEDPSPPRKPQTRPGYAHVPPEAATWTLEQVKAWVQANSAEGFTCPACLRFGKTYWRKLNSSMAYCLILIHKFYRDHSEYERRFIHMNGYIASLSNLPPRMKAAVRGDFCKLRFWGFIEGKDEFREDGSERNGYWRITEAGHLFARGLTSAAARIQTYNDELLGMDDRRVTIQEALGKKFNYAELMATIH